MFRAIWRFITATKNAVGNLLFIALVIIIVVSILSSEDVYVPEKTALVINPSGIIVEQEQVVDPFSKFMSQYDDEPPETRLKDILDAIDEGAKDSRVAALVLDLRRLQGAAFSKLEEIGNAIDEFKQTGKPVLAYARSYSQGQYYLASHADEIYLDEDAHQLLGGVFLTGLASYPLFYQEALEKLKVKFHVYKVGAYKSAVEPYVRNDMSPEAKESNQAWLDALWQEYSNTVIKHRELDPAGFDNYTNKYGELLAVSNSPTELARQYGLVDDLLNREEWIDRVASIVGYDEESYSRIDFKSYLSITQPPIPTLNPTSNKVAVITASGVIYDGERPPGEIGGDSIAQLFRDAQNNTSVKAVVFRVDSPGGSASASEVIRSELIRTQRAGKPVVVSMGSYAASGGYWISAPASKIFAAETTLTGSIGTFVTFPDFTEAAKTLGIHADGVGTTDLSQLFNPLAGVPASLDQILRHGVNYTYRKFLELVAEGRNMTPEAVDKIAQGRVWVATDALENGLVDSIGDLNDAIDSAALLADLGSYEVLYLEQELSPREQFINQVLNSSADTLNNAVGGMKLETTLPFQKVRKEVRRLIEMSQSADIYAQCLECDLSF